MCTDSIEQLRGTAGDRQVKVRAEIALAAFTTPSSGGWIMFGNPELTAFDTGNHRLAAITRSQRSAIGQSLSLVPGAKVGDAAHRRFEFVALAGRL